MSYLADKKVQQSDEQIDIGSIPVVFFMGVGRCGLYLTKSVFDWHDEVIILPMTNKFYPVWEKYQCDEISDPDKIADIFLDNSVFSWFKEDYYHHPYSNQDYDFTNVNWSIFSKSFREFLRQREVSSRNTFLGLFYAYTLASKNNLKTAKVIMADAFYDDFTEAVLRDFPDARFIHIMRDHRANISSLKAFYLSMYGRLTHPKKKWTKGGSLFIDIIKDSMVVLMRMLHRNLNVMGNGRYFVLKFEDLKMKGNDAINRLSEWLGIENNAALLNLTMAGKETAGNSAFYDERVKGASTEPVYRWKKHLRENEIRMIEFLFGKSMDQTGYERIYKNNVWNRFVGFLCCFLPWQGEIFYNGFRKNLAKEEKKKQFRQNVIKPIVYFPFNIYMFILSRCLLLKSMLFGELKLIEDK